MTDAAASIVKMEEVRIVLNRLIGPAGVMTEVERNKYLKGVPGAGQPEPVAPAKPLGNVGLTAPSNKAL